ncbi:conserved phage C-terminal domain-containing protein [Lentilactobacillus buchneri]|uniref:conserved phage C-terminal domain-containing protein n=1 Tax=Lentilactobacillus buchneri TaxID=1581 RepID=UPI0011EF630C|nr:conserved phage C-terminal domain-containing protein [Lentilactobacillus buchneri]
MSNLLISEPPLQVLPSLAVKVGLNEAIILQQFHYWLQRSKNIHDGYRWIYNSYREWNKQFPFWGLNTLKRAITSLEKSGYLIPGNYNKAGFDKTKWYRINYELLGMGQRSTQNGSTMNPEWDDGTAQNGSTNTNRLPETTTENTKNYSTAKAEPSFPWESVIDYLNEKASKHYRHTEANKRLVMARHKEGFSADDMRQVIDNQCSEWLNDNKMNRYLRPATLFQASKFEGYLNNTSIGSQKPKTRKDWFG